MGLHREVQKHFGSNVINYVISVRTAQGFEDSLTSTAEERRYILNQWVDHKAEYQNVHQQLRVEGPEGQESGRLSPKGFLQTRHLSFDERKKLHEDRKKRREDQLTKTDTDSSHKKCPFCRKKANDKTDQQLTPIQSGDTTESRGDDISLELEHAIHSSVEATSRGNPEEDVMIEAAIRASMRELESGNTSTLTDEEAMDRAIQASIAEASRLHAAEESSNTTNMSDEDAKHQAMLEKAIQESLREYQLSSDSREAPATEVEIISPNDTLATESDSKSLATANEDEIVMNFIKKQSLQEEDYRQAALRKEAEEQGTEADEEALKQAIEASLKGGSG